MHDALINTAHKQIKHKHREAYREVPSGLNKIQQHVYTSSDAALNQALVMLMISQNCR